MRKWQRGVGVRLRFRSGQRQNYVTFRKQKQSCNVCLLGCLLFVLLIFPGGRVAAEQILYSLVAQGDGSSTSLLQLNISSLDDLQLEERIQVVMPDGAIRSGILKRILPGLGVGEDLDQREASRGVIALSDAPGGIEVWQRDERVTRIIIHDAARERFYRAEIDATGKGLLQEDPADDYLCVHYPSVDETQDQMDDIPPLAGLTPSVSELQNLQSRPGATNTIYINYWAAHCPGRLGTTITTMVMTSSIAHIA